MELVRSDSGGRIPFFAVDIPLRGPGWIRPSGEKKTPEQLIEELEVQTEQIGGSSQTVVCPHHPGGN